MNTNVDDLVTYIVDKYGIDVPVLDEENMAVDQQEAKRDVSGDPLRAAHLFSGGAPVYVTGTEVIVEVPFSGDPQMFQVKPKTSNLNPSRGEVRGNTVTFRYWSDTAQTDQVRQELDRWLGDIKQYLQWQQDSFKQFNDELARLARVEITKRQDKLLANQNLVAGLGIKLKRRPEPQ